MIRLLLALLAMISSLGAMTPGRAALFEHIDDRWRSLNGGDEFDVCFTGQGAGLMLQCPKNTRVLFPTGKSTVLIPTGQRINLDFKEYHDRMPGYWEGKFAVPHVMTKRIYNYVVVILIDGKEHEFRHALKYSFEKSEQDKESETQRELEDDQGADGDAEEAP